MLKGHVFKNIPVELRGKALSDFKTDALRVGFVFKNKNNGTLTLVGDINQMGGLCDRCGESEGGKEDFLVAWLDIELLLK